MLDVEVIFLELLKCNQLIPKIIRIEIDLDLFFQQLIQLRSKYCTISIEIFEAGVEDILLQGNVVVKRISEEERLIERDAGLLSEMKVPSIIFLSDRNRKEQ